MTIRTVHICEHCRRNYFELAEAGAAIYTPMKRGQHATCAPCMEEGKRAGLVYEQIMVMNKEAYDRALKNYEMAEEKAAERKVIPFDPKKKLPKPTK
jgi:hypothetical protein